MPSLKELNKFRNDLRNLGNEMEVTTKWGERFEEYPFPERAPVPELDVNDLLGSIDVENTPLPEKEVFTENEKQDSVFDAVPAKTEASENFPFENDLPSPPPIENSDFQESGLKNFDDINLPPAGTFGMPSEEYKALDSDNADFTAITDSNTSFDLSSTNKKEPEELKDDAESNFNFEIPLAESGEEVSLFEEELDLDEADEESGSKKSSFNNMISNLDLDSPLENTDINDDAPNLPEELLSGLSNLVEEAGKENETEYENKKSKENTEDTEDTIEEFTEPEFSNSFMSGNTDFTKDIEDIPEAEDISEVEELTEEVSASETENIFEAQNKDASFNSSEADFFDSSSGFENIEQESISLYEEENVPEAVEDLEDFSQDLSGEDGFSTQGLSEGTDEEELRGMEMMDGVEVPDIDISDIASHTGFAIGDDILSEHIEESGGGDFIIPEDFSKFSAENNFSYKSKTESENAAAEGAEAIPLSISAEDYEYLVDRLSSFPLNVRLEIEDYLANGKDTEISKMEIVNFIITNVPLKKIVAKLEDSLDKSIPIPKGFQRKSVEDYELEKKSLKYKFFHKILPAAILTSMILILAFCLSVLAWQFIYKPAVSESIYKHGITFIDNENYDEAVKQFDEAGTYKKKKNWYFKYANAFRNKKQFNSAEKIYKRLLFDFNHDKKGGIEYSEMLSKDLRNYEKAENVLRRSVLDYHINDEQAILALGEVYLDWAYEDSSKYEKARETYSSLITMYGKKDSFLAGMMKYFMRTDNLAEVLPLKEHFMNKKAKISLDDFTELGGYLLEKRYEPKASDSETLREQIDDLREILERAIKQDSSNAEANYNMGKFFIHNRKPEAAEFYLAQAIGIYKNETGMPPLKMIKNLDSMRLYGKILSDNKEFLKAQEIFANALTKYKDYSGIRILPPNEKIGKLYEDYADINYFISGDMDSALNAYTQAVNEMNNTPTIQYRIGYIYYQKGNYLDAMRSMTNVYAEKPDDRNLLYGFGNVLYKRGSYYAAQAYYERLMEMLEAEKIRKGLIMPQTRPDHAEFVDEYMKASNNLGVILNKLAKQSGSSEKNGRALALFGDSVRAWDSLTRNPQTMISSKAVSLAYLNIQNMVKPISTFETEIYSDIPKTLQNEKVLKEKVDR